MIKIESSQALNDVNNIKLSAMCRSSLICVREEIAHCVTEIRKMSNSDIKKDFNVEISFDLCKAVIETIRMCNIDGISVITKSDYDFVQLMTSQLSQELGQKTFVSTTLLHVLFIDT